MSSITGIALGRQSRWAAIRREIGRALIAVIIALVVTCIIVVFTSKAPLEALNTLLTAPLSKPRTIGLWLDDAAKLTVTGLAFSLVFQARQFALGVQGQVYVGASCRDLRGHCRRSARRHWASSSASSRPWPAGAFYGFLPGIAKAKLGANEIVSSLMLNYIAIDLCNYLVRRQLRGTGHDLRPSASPMRRSSRLLFANTRIDLGLVIALVAVAVVWFALYRTSWGLKLRLVGHNAALCRICRHQRDLHHGLGDDCRRRAGRPARLDVRAGRRPSAS